jgi:serine/threonine protein kinase/tetratricopeptide (TPR) repeat protein
MSADRNLLFGILAVQMDFVSPTALVAGMNAWLLRKDRPLSDHLLDQGCLAADHAALIEGLVTAHLKRHENDAERSLAALSSAQLLVQTLKQRFADRDVQASLAHVGSGTLMQPVAPPAKDDSEPRFRILRPHARGGLGEVYVAEDRELRREVALKEIQPGFAKNQNSRGRFLLEAEVTGGLEHPNIVPVYGLGTYADGRPYYAMRFIRGDSFKEAADRFHATKYPDDSSRNLAFRNLLKRFVDVCNAVAYAHSRGILHRDLKPGNVMLGKYGETLVVDWGLAKPVADGTATARDAETERALQPSSGNSYVETMHGAAVGTPAFMSPEQAAGRIDDLGPTSDVYSLGATLYAIVTGTPPFAGEVGEILKRVEAGEFRPPREVAADVPAPLDAVIRKAMARRKEDRYATATDLAAEIENLLADEPVTAYREPPVTRVRRWGRKHPGVVAALASTVFVGVAGLGAGLYFVNAEKNLKEMARREAVEASRRAEEQRVIADDQRALAERERNRAEGERQVAQAVRHFLQKNLLSQASVSEQMNAQRASRGSPADAKQDVTIKELLGRAANEFSPQTVGEKFPAQPLIQAEILGTIADAFEAIDENARAVTFAKAKCECLESQLGMTHPAAYGANVDLVFAYMAAGRHADAMSTAVAVIDRLGERLRAEGSAADGTIDQAFASIWAHFERRLDLKVFVLPTFNSVTPGALFALVKLKMAIPTLREIAALTAKRFGPTSHEANTIDLILAFALHGTGDLDGAARLYESVLASGSARIGPNDLRVAGLQQVYAVTLITLRRDPEKSLDLLKRSTATIAPLLGPDHPATISSKVLLAGAYMSRGRHADAVPLFDLALTAHRTLYGPDHGKTLATLNALATCLDKTGQHARAQGLYEEAWKKTESKLGPDDPATHEARDELAESYRADGKFDRAIPLLDTTRALRAAKQGPDHVKTLDSVNRLAGAYLDAGKNEAARPLIAEYLRGLRKRASPNDPEFADALSATGQRLMKAQEYEPAQKAFAECLAIREAAQPAVWTTPLTKSLLGGALLAMKKFDEAGPLLVSGYEGMKAAEAKIPASRKFRLPEACDRLIQFAEATNKPDDVKKWKAEKERWADVPRPAGGKSK